MEIEIEMNKQGWTCYHVSKTILNLRKIQQTKKGFLECQR